MRTRSIGFAALLAAALLVAQARAVEVSGIRLDDKIDVGGVPLVLNGAGLRTKLMLKIYVVGLYLPSRTNRADAVIDSAQLRHVRLVMKRGLGAGTIWDAFDEGIRANSSAAELSALEARMAQLEKMFKDFGEVAEGDAIDIDFRIDGTTAVSNKGKPAGEIQGADLQRALLKIWLGEHPVQSDLKSALLAGR